MAVTTVVFDVGETLIDETPQWEAVADAPGVPRLTSFGVAMGLIERGEDHRRVYEVIGVERPRGLELEPGRLYPDARPCLEELRRRGYRIGVAANQPARTTAFLLEHGCAMDFAGSAEEWGVEKPAPEFFEHVVEAAGASASAIAYVGDRVDYDVVPAKRAGMISVFLRRGPCGFLQASWPQADRADLRIDSLAELPEALERV